MRTVRAKVATISILLIGIYIFISIVCHDPVANGLKCGLFFEAGILLPGLVITLLLSAKKDSIKINVIELFVLYWTGNFHFCIYINDAGFEHQIHIFVPYNCFLAFLFSRHT